MQYNKLNNLVGWLVFLVATAVYFLTLESTASLWDCGEYITAANKLEVGHPPGAPLFMVLGRLFSFFAEPEMVAVWINRLSALSSSFTILFMYWSITMFAKKILQRNDRNWSKGDQIAAIGAGMVGALAYTFSDSFWFSAVEGEVYAMSSLFTAAIFWAILKWDSEMTAIKNEEIVPDRSPMRWMILIMFLFGLAIGVHLLGLLVVPAIAYVMYFQLWKKITIPGILLTGVLSVVILAFIQEGVIPGIVAIASGFEVGFVNSIGLPFYSGTIFFFILLIAGFVWGFRYAVRKAKPILSTVLWSFAVLLIGYGSFAVIVIRSNANTPLDENDPENLVTLHAYLKREQYGSWPILNGPYWNSFKNGEVLKEDGTTEIVSTELWKDLSPFYVRRFVVLNGEAEIKAFKDEGRATAYAKKKGPSYEVVEKYFSSNEKIRKNRTETYQQSTFLPRMYYTSQDPNDPKILKYKEWSGYDANNAEVGSETGTDGLRLPTFGENLQYLFGYQVNWMYWRYFMWNFAGRQNDIQGHGDEMRGNWTSGFSQIDDERIGSSEFAPSYTKNNPANNTFWMLPLVLGIVGMIFHFYRAPKDAFVVFLLFIFTGLAIVIYLNQKPFEPRERDYAYAASFYAFAFWIGLGVLAIYEVYKNFVAKDWKGMGTGAMAVTLFVAFCAAGGGFIIFKTWVFIALMGLAFLALGFVLRKIVPNHAIGAVLITVVCGIVPFIMAEQGWDDHDRSGKTSARDLANDYLMSCKPNSIIFTAGDNDTFPLWYLQEVEGKYTDIRVCNTSLFDTDWYTEQMMLKTYESEALPISFTEDQILMFAGGTDQALFGSTAILASGGVKRERIETVFNAKKKNNELEFATSYTGYQTAGLNLLNAVKANDNTFNARITQLKTAFATPVESVNYGTVELMNAGLLEIFDGYRNGLLTADVQMLQQVSQQMYEWEKPWSFLPIADAMKFIKEDENMIDNGGIMMRVFPCSGFIIPVDADNAVKSGLITEKDKAKCEKEIRFSFTASGITKSDIMILDMLNNNKWKRAMYFSSPGGTDVSMALYRAGYLRSNGMAWAISPISGDPNQPYETEEMYNNLMTRYTFGDMSNPDVLTDYYARRQTATFRSTFGQLATYYLNEAERERSNQKQFSPIIKNMRAAGQNQRADSLAKVIEGADGRIANYNQRAIKLIKRSLEVMPANIVIDYGEQVTKARDLQGPDGASYFMYQDGNLHEYVSMLYRAGAKADAEKLGQEVADQIESIFNYFSNSDATIAARNYSDYAAAVANYLQMHQIVVDKTYGNPNGALASRTDKMVQKLYQTDLPAIYTALETMATENGELGRGSSGTYSSYLTTLQGNMEAVGAFFQVIDAPNAPNVPQPGNTPPPNSEAILNKNDTAVADETSAVRMSL